MEREIFFPTTKVLQRQLDLADDIAGKTIPTICLKIWVMHKNLRGKYVLYLLIALFDVRIGIILVDQGLLTLEAGVNIHLKSCR